MPPPAAICHTQYSVITFGVRRSRGEMYISHGHLCVCLSVCPSPHSHTTAWTRCNLENGRGCPLVVQYLADLQSVHGFRCYHNTHVCKLIVLYAANAYSAEHEISASTCTRSTAGNKQW